MNSTTAGVVRKLKDSNAQYYWSPPIAAGQPATLAGYPVETDENMPDIGANLFPIAVGDFKRGYLITIASAFASCAIRSPISRTSCSTPPSAPAAACSMATLSSSLRSPHRKCFRAVADVPTVRIGGAERSHRVSPRAPGGPSIQHRWPSDARLFVSSGIFFILEEVPME
jgi:hypothetical protein